MTIPDPIACKYLWKSPTWRDPDADHLAFLVREVRKLMRYGYRRILLGRLRGKHRRPGCG